MEFLDIRDKNGNPTGEVKERSLVHADGDIHGTSHVWIVRKNEKGSYDSVSYTHLTLPTNSLV